MYLFKLKKGNTVLSITAFVDFFVVFTDWRSEKKEFTLLALKYGILLQMRF